MILVKTSKVGWKILAPKGNHLRCYFYFILFLFLFFFCLFLVFYFLLMTHTGLLSCAVFEPFTPSVLKKHIEHVNYDS